MSLQHFVEETQADCLNQLSVVTGKDYYQPDTLTLVV